MYQGVILGIRVLDNLRRPQSSQPDDQRQVHKLTGPDFNHGQNGTGKSGVSGSQGGAAVARGLESASNQTKATVSVLKQDVGQLKVDGNNFRDRLKKLEEKE
jgi:hypothetical protein